MAKFSLIRNSFSAGKMSQKFEGRTDFEQYRQGCLEYTNFITRKSGGAAKRSGTRRGQVFPTQDISGLYTLNLAGAGPSFFDDNEVITVGDIPASKDWVLPVQNNVKIGGAQGQIFLDSNFLNYLLGLYNGGLLIDEPIKGNSWTPLQIGQLLLLVQNEGRFPPLIVYPDPNLYSLLGILQVGSLASWSRTPEPLRYPYRNNVELDLVVNPSGSTGTITVAMEDSSAFSVKYFTAGMANSIFRVQRASTEGLFRVIGRPRVLATTAFDDSANTITVPTTHVLTNGDLIRFDDWTGELPPEINPDLKYFVKGWNNSTGEFQLSTALTLIDTVDFSAPASAGNVSVTYLLTSRTRAQVLVSLSTTSATDRWSQGMWDYSFGWPRTGSFFQDRLVLAGNPLFPEFVYNSRTDSLFHFMQFPLIQDRTSTDSSGLRFFGSADAEDFPFTYTVGSGEANRIHWMSAQRSLFIGTAGAEYVVNAAQGIYGRLNGIPQVIILPQTFYGSLPIAASRQDLSAFFVARDGRSIRNFRYSDNNGSNVSEDMTILVEDLVYTGPNSSKAGSVSFSKILWAQSFNALFALDTEGFGYLLSLEPSSGVQAWTNLEIGAPIIDACYVPRGKGRIELMVARPQGRMVETLFPIFENSEIINDSPALEDTCVYLDSSRILTSETPESLWEFGNTFANLTGLTALIDGQYVEEVTSGDRGQVLTQREGTHIVVGFRYASKIETMPLEGGSVVGSSQSLLKRVDRATLRLHNSRGGNYGFEQTFYPIEYPEIEANKLFSGSIQLDLDSNYEQRYTVKIEHDEPFPFTALALIMRGEAQE